MNTMRIHPVILCGGSGTRLWPKSRKARPKPFIPLIGDKTLFQAALSRVKGDEFAPATIVAGPQHVDLIEAQARGHDLQIVVEPCARNTAPAIALAAARLDPGDVMLVCPSDHFIADEDAFRDAARAAFQLAREDKLVAFGITADRPETGYGYIRRGKPLSGGYSVAEFVEKPDAGRAMQFLASGEYAWNGGIFVFRACAVLSELRRQRPDMAELVAAAVANGSESGTLFHPDAESFAGIAGESIDYAVMEGAKDAAVVPVSMGWSDIGSWAALHDALETDEDGNSVEGPAQLLDCENVLSISDGPRISAVGVKDLCIVVDGDEVLVTSRDGAQLVGKLDGAANQ